jgi:ABC-type cobalamin transport system permease subunit
VTVHGFYTVLAALIAYAVPHSLRLVLQRHVREVVDGVQCGGGSASKSIKLGIGVVGRLALSSDEL